MSALNRVRFNDIASDSGAYTLSINPASVELVDSDYQTQLKTVDSNPVWQKSLYDPRIRKLIWHGFQLNGTGIHSTFATQLAVLRGYIGDEKYINLRDIAVPNSKLSSGYKKVFIVDVNTKLRDNIGTIKYERVELIFQILEVQ